MAIDPRIAQRQIELAAKEAEKKRKLQAAQGNSGIGNNEYTNVADRKKQNFTVNAKVSQTPTGNTGDTGSTGSGSAGGVITLTTQNSNKEYIDAINKNLASQLSAAEKLKTQQLDALTANKDKYIADQLALKEDQDALVNSNFDNASALLGRTNEDAQRQNYIAYMMGKKNMPQISAAIGNGGMAQSLLAKQQLGYEENRSAADQNYLDQLNEAIAQRDAALAQNGSAYTTNVSSYDLNYLNDIAKVESDYLAKVQNLENDAFNKKLSVEAANPVQVMTTTVPTSTKTSSGASTYNINGKDYTAQEFVSYLKNMGMTQAEIANYMKAKGLSL